MKRRITLVAVALVLALIGVVAVRSYVGKANARAVNGLDPVRAYVAEAAIPAGTTLKDAVTQGLAKTESLPRKTVPLGAVTGVTPVLGGLVAKGMIPSGTLLLQTAFGLPEVQANGLPLSKGLMAVTIPLGDPQRVGGFVQPGADVAIFDTYNTIPAIGAQGQAPSGGNDTAAGDGLTMGETKEHVTRLLLARVSVVAVGQSVAGATSVPSPSPTAAPAGGSGSSGSAQSSSDNTVLVTLALRQRDVEKLILASQTGQLYFALLNKDSQVAPDHGANNTNLFQ